MVVLLSLKGRQSATFGFDASHGVGKTWVVLGSILQQNECWRPSSSLIGDWMDQLSPMGALLTVLFCDHAPILSVDELNVSLADCCPVDHLIPWHVCMCSAKKEEADLHSNQSASNLKISTGSDKIAKPTRCSFLLYLHSTCNCLSRPRCNDTQILNCRSTNLNCSLFLNLAIGLVMHWNATLATPQSV